MLRRRSPRKTSRIVRDLVQRLESRTLLAAVTWDGGGDGTNWTDPLNWSGNALPAAADDVTIDVAANPTVTLSTGTQTIKSLVTKEALRIQGGTLAVTTTADIDNVLTMFGGTLSGGAYDVTGGSLVASTSGGVLSSVAITGDVLLNVTSASLRLAGTTTFTAARLTANNATLQLSPGATLNSLVVSEGAATGNRNIVGAVGGAGTATFGPQAIIRLAAGSGAGLDIQNSSQVTLTNNGLITAEATGQALTISTAGLTNSGTMQVSAGTLTVNAANWTNPGTITGTGGTVNLGGTLNTAAGIGTLNTAAATVNVTGTISNAGNTITLNSNTGGWRMLGGSINDGSMNLTGGTNLLGTTSGGTLSSVAITGEVLLNTTSAVIRLAGTPTFTAARLSANNATLQLSPGVTINSLVVSEGAATGNRNIVGAVGGTGTATFGPQAIIRLAAGSGAGLDIQNSSQATITNNGLITAEATGQTLSITTAGLTNNGMMQVSAGTLNIAAASWTNPGTVAATGGSVNIGGTLNATSGIGTFNTAAGTVNVTGTITNTGNTITLNAATGSWRMFGGTINNGSVNLTGGTNLVTTTSGGVLSSVAITGEVLLNVTSAVIRLAGTTTFSAARLSANNATLQLSPGATINSLVVSEGAATGNRNIGGAVGGTGTAAFGPQAIIRLAAGSGGGLDIQNSSQTTLTNNGLITAEAAGQTLNISTTGLINNGILQVIAGTLNVNATNWTNPGTINGTGGSVNLGGTLDATAGIGTFTTAGATVNVSGTINNTGNTVTLNATTGSWRMFGGTLQNGAMNLTGGTNLIGTTSGGVLSSIAITGEVLLNVTSAVVRLAGTPTFTAARLSANNATLQLSPSATLNSLVVSEGAATGNRNIVGAVGGTGTATFGPQAVVRLAAGSGAGLDIQNSSQVTITNNGLITAEAAGQTLNITSTGLINNGTMQVSAGTLTINATNWSNPGTISGTGGTVNIGGTLDATAGIGTFNTSAATVNVSGTINNTGNTITLNATTGSWRMFGGTISNGAMNLTGGTSLFGTTSGGTLSSVAITGEVLLNVTSATVRLSGTTTFSAARLQTNNTTLQMSPGATLNSLVVAEGGAAGNRNITLAVGGTGTATFGPQAVVRLANTSAADLDIQNSSQATLTNNGLITAESNGRAINISPTTFINNGTVRASNSTVRIVTQVGPVGTLTAGGFWELDNNGRLATNAAVNTLDLDLRVSGPGNGFSGGLTGANGLNLLRGQATFASGAVLNVTPGGGTLKIAGIVDLAADARFNVTGNVTFVGTNQPLVAAEVASATSMGRLVATGTVDLANPDGGVVRFDVDLVGAYDPPTGTRFDIIQGTDVINDLGAFFGDTTPSGRILLVGRDNTNLYAIVGTGTPPPAPSVNSLVFEYETREAVVFSFNSNLSAFVSRRDIKLTNLTTNTVIPNTQGRLTYNATGDQAILLTGDLPDGRYKLEVQAADISNSAGQTLTQPLLLNFFILRGDANRDGTVGFDDLLVLSQNYNQTGRTYSTGNFDYSADGKVSFDDLLIVAQHYGVTLPAMTMEVTPAAKPTVAASKHRSIDAVIN